MLILLLNILFHTEKNLRFLDHGSMILKVETAVWLTRAEFNRLFLKFKHGLSARDVDCDK